MVLIFEAGNSVVGLRFQIGPQQPPLRIGLEIWQPPASHQIAHQCGDEHRLARPRQPGHAEPDRGCHKVGDVGIGRAQGIGCIGQDIDSAHVELPPGTALVKGGPRQVQGSQTVLKAVRRQRRKMGPRAKREDDNGRAGTNSTVEHNKYTGCHDGQRHHDDDSGTKKIGHLGHSLIAIHYCNQCTPALLNAV